MFSQMTSCMHVFACKMQSPKWLSVSKRYLVYIECIHVQYIFDTASHLEVDNDIIRCFSHSNSSYLASFHMALGPWVQTRHKEAKIQQC